MKTRRSERKDLGNIRFFRVRSASTVFGARSQWSTTSENTPHMLDERRYYVLVTVVAAVCLFFVLLYLRYKHVSEQRQCTERAALIEEGDDRLQQEFFRADGSLNPTPFVYDDGGGAEDNEVEADKEKEKQPKGIVTQVVDSIKSGNLLRTINRFATRTNQISERLAERETAEDKEERQQWSRLADEAVNPLFPRRVAQIKRDRAEYEQRKENTERRHAAAATLLARNPGNSEKRERDDKGEDGGNSPNQQQQQQQADHPGTIYNFNEEQLQALSTVMSTTST